MHDQLTDQQLDELARVVSDLAFHTGDRNGWVLATLPALITEVRERRQQFADIRAAVNGVHTFISKHNGRHINVCAAWNDLIRLVR
jgi:hypothetical protein